MRKILVILFCSVFFCSSVHGESNKKKWLKLKKDLVGYLDPCWQNIRSHKPAWDKEDAGKKEMEQTMAELRQLYARAVKVPLHPVFDRALYLEQQRTMNAAWTLILELEKWNSYSDIIFGQLLQTPLAMRTDDTSTRMPGGARKQSLLPGTLQGDVRKINEGLYQKTAERINEHNWRIIEELSQLRSNDLIIIKNIAFTFRIERYISLVEAYKELEHLIAPERTPGIE